MVAEKEFNPKTKVFTAIARRIIDFLLYAARVKSCASGQQFRSAVISNCELKGDVIIRASFKRQSVLSTPALMQIEL
jgi:hypothetical protein